MNSFANFQTQLFEDSTCFPALPGVGYIPQSHKRLLRQFVP
jgi:hypothetical protein